MNALLKLSHFTELGRMLGWGSWTKIMTLWAFMDESGLHKTGGALVKLTVGGCIAEFEAWEGLAAYWASYLQMWHLKMFRMSRFEKQNPPHQDYASWTEQDRRNRLNMLLDLIAHAHVHCFGFTNYFRNGDTTESIYQRCAHDVLLTLGRYEEKMGIVFAIHPEYGRHNMRLSELVKHGYGDNIISCTVANPSACMPTSGSRYRRV